MHTRSSYCPPAKRLHRGTIGTAVVQRSRYGGIENPRSISRHLVDNVPPNPRQRNLQPSAPSPNLPLFCTPKSTPAGGFRKIMRRVRCWFICKPMVNYAQKLFPLFPTHTPETLAARPSSPHKIPWHTYFSLY